MAIKRIRCNDDECLRKQCEKVAQVDHRIRQILNDMMDTLHNTENGAALAANQIGILEQLVVIDYCGYTLKLVNPQIIGYSGVQECIEGCLSFPDRFVKTIRPAKVTIEALNQYGEEMILTGQGEMAKCFYHELEHLDGEIFLDKAIEEIESVT